MPTWVLIYLSVMLILTVSLWSTIIFFVYKRYKLMKDKAREFVEALKDYLERGK